MVRKWAIPVASVIGGVLFVGIGLPWLTYFTPRWLVLRAAIIFLWFLLGAFSLSVPAAAIGTVWSWLALARARRRRERDAQTRATRWLLLATSSLASFIVMELVVRITVDWSYRIPEPRTQFKESPDRAGTRAVPERPSRRDRDVAARPGANDEESAAQPVGGRPDGSSLNILVLGESSAAGVPYQPWVSVGQIVGWQMERILPGRKVHVDLRARGGFCLEEALLPLTNLDHRPDAVILFSGHNEFHARYGWSRNVRHYVEEGPESLLGLQELGRSISSTTYLILQTLDRFYGEAPPPPHVTRELVDHPSFTPKEYVFLRREFERRLDSLAVYSNRIGALAILIVPGSNDGSYEPSRSVLAAATPPAARAEFAAAFQAARAAETSDPAQAMAAYRRLVAQHPEFAESHYRLARMLANAGDWHEAAEQFVLARDQDAFPHRCPTDFRAIFHTVAHRRGSMLVDGPAILAALSPHAILDDRLYHDAHHLNLVGEIALAQDILEQLRARRAFGWPESTPVPRIGLEDCARAFDLDREKWATVCMRSADFYSRLAYVRYDPTDRLDVQHRYERAAEAITAARPIDETSPPSLAPMRPILERLRAKQN